MWCHQPGPTYLSQNMKNIPAIARFIPTSQKEVLCGLIEINSKPP